MEGETDTGPGLEAHVSWDYSHSPVVTDALTASESCLKRRVVGATADKSSAEPEEARFGSNSVVYATTDYPKGQVTGGSRMKSAFEPGSRQVGWQQPRQSQGGVDQRQSHFQQPERAETAEEKIVRVKAEKKAQRMERAAQATSLAVLSLLLIASTLFVVLAYTGWNVVAAAGALFCASVAGYPSVQLLWYALSSQMFRCWPNLTPEDQFKWGQKGASSVHSSIMALVGITVLVNGNWREIDLITGRDDRVAAFIGLELGYLLQDTGMEVYKQIAFRHSFGLLHWIHHLVIMTGLLFYYKYFKGDYFFGAFFLWNTSTVPLQLRWFQSTSGMQKGMLYQLNNLALLLSFLVCRILMIPFLMHLYGRQKGWRLYEVPYRIPGVYTLMCGGLILINMIWLFQLLKHAFKRKSRHKSISGKTC